MNYIEITSQLQPIFLFVPDFIIHYDILCASLHALIQTYSHAEIHKFTLANIFSSSSSSSSGFYNPLAGFSVLILEVSRSQTTQQVGRTPLDE